VPEEPATQTPANRELPPFARVQSTAERRPATPEALAVVDRTLDAARGVLTEPAIEVVVAPPPPSAPPAPKVKKLPPSEPTPPELTTISRSGGKNSVQLFVPDNSTVEIREGETLVVGRDPATCGIVSPNPEVSRQQVRLELQQGVLSATQLGSSNKSAIVRGGSLTNLRINEAAPLEAGDQIVVSGDILICTVGSARGDSG